MFLQEKQSNPRQTIVPIAAGFEDLSSIDVCEFSIIIPSLKTGCQLFLVSTSNCANPCASYDGNFKSLLLHMLGDVNACVEHPNVVFNLLIHASKEVQCSIPKSFVQFVSFYRVCLLGVRSIWCPFMESDDSKLFTSLEDQTMCTFKTLELAMCHEFT